MSSTSRPSLRIRWSTYWSAVTAEVNGVVMAPTRIWERKDDRTSSSAPAVQYVKPDVATTCMGQAASAAAVLLSAGAPGKRLGLPHSRVLIHQPSGGAEGQSVDIEIQAREIIRMRRMLDEILATHTGQDVEKIGRDTDRDFIMTASQAKEYGIIDEIIESREAAEELLAVASGQ